MLLRSAAGCALSPGRAPRPVCWRREAGEEGDLLVSAVGVKTLRSSLVGGPRICRGSSAPGSPDAIDRPSLLAVLANRASGLRLGGTGRFRVCGESVGTPPDPS